MMTKFSIFLILQKHNKQTLSLYKIFINVIDRTIEKW
jgi:hypothetical protein